MFGVKNSMLIHHGHSLQSRILIELQEGYIGIVKVKSLDRSCVWDLVLTKPSIHISKVARDVRKKPDDHRSIHSPLVVATACNVDFA